MPNSEHAGDPSNHPVGGSAGPGRPINELACALSGTDEPDIHVTTAAEGLTWLHRYEDEGDEATLVKGMTCLQRCLAEAPDHPDRYRWQLWLGIGQAERGRRLGRITDYHESIDQIADLYVQTPPADQLRERIAKTLIDLCCDRLLLLRRDEPEEPMSPDPVQALIIRVTPLLTSANPDARSHARVVTGLAHLERYELTGERADLDRGVDLLAAATWDLEPGTTVLARVGGELANGLRRQGILDGDPGLLEQAVNAATRAIQDGDPDDEGSRSLLYLYRAYAQEARWQVTDDTADLRAALVAWRTASVRTN